MGRAATRGNLPAARLARSFGRAHVMVCLWVCSLIKAADDSRRFDGRRAGGSKIPQSAHWALGTGLVPRGASFGMTITDAQRLSSRVVRLEAMETTFATRQAA